LIKLRNNGTNELNNKSDGRCESKWLNRHSQSPQSMQVTHATTKQYQQPPKGQPATTEQQQISSSSNHTKSNQIKSRSPSGSASMDADNCETLQHTQASSC
jgi:hypothetical protein